MPQRTASSGSVSTNIKASFLVNFREYPKGEVPRILLLRTRVNKG
jgi:hypothetical protein